MGFKDIKIEPMYNSLMNNVVDEFYTPVLSQSILYERAVGFFSSTALLELAKGIEGLIKNEGAIHVIASPRLNKEDIEAIEHGFELKEVVETSLLRELKEPKNKFEGERLNFLSNLIAHGILDIKIAFLDNNNENAMFHIKTGLMHDSDGNVIAFTGSMNETLNAFSHNYETVDVFKSWTDDGQDLSESELKRIEYKQIEFLNLWENCQPKVKVHSFTSIKDEIVKRYLKKDVFKCSDTKVDKDEFSKALVDAPRIPSDFNIRDYQLTAVDNWIKEGYKGIFDMATGTGKTYTALIGISKLFKNNNDRLAIIIVCPFQHLVEQWVEDIEKFGMKPIICHSASKQKNWKSIIENKIELFNDGLLNSFCFVVTNASFSSEYFQNAISALYQNTLIVIDEAHNFGAKHLKETLPEKIPYRLALSATITRHNDEVGSEALLNYFGNICIKYTLKDAIDNQMLTPYYYYPIEVQLTESELEEYLSITSEIGKALLRCKKKNGKILISEKVEALLLKRARLVAGASDKLIKLKETIKDYKNDNHMLVYCGSTTLKDVEYKEGIPPIDEIKQINAVTYILGNELLMKVSKFTSEESADERAMLKESFNEGRQIQALIAIRCLDEGVNIPSIDKAFILASSSNPKEYIQRRGRVLRLYPGKKYSIIYDFITVPIEIDLLDAYPENIKNSLKSLVQREVNRMEDFASIALNPSETDFLVADLKRAYNLYNGSDLNDEFE